MMGLWENKNEELKTTSLQPGFRSVESATYVRSSCNTGFYA
jgi:hypothetical protein